VNEHTGQGRPRLELVNLGSGSSGNCSLLSTRRGQRILIDCGFSMRRTARALSELGVELQDLDGIVLTHLDRDHFNPAWSRRIEQLGLQVHVADMHEREAVSAGCPETCLVPFEDIIDFGHGLRARTHLVAHDDSGCVAYRFECDDCSLGFATDLGHVPDSLISFLEGIDVLAFESNYDRSMQVQSDRPEFLKQRIMGGSGHLSNEQALHAILRIDQASALQHVVLLHLSRQCNEPQRIRELYRACAPHLLERLVITGQDAISAAVEIEVKPAGADSRPLVPTDLERAIGQPLKETG
jgi:phosphoribosyl 1,2-cyclic phosphodiesterase